MSARDATRPGSPAAGRGPVDEAHALRAALSAREDELVELQAAFGEFAASAGHELKSPLNKMLVFAELLEPEVEAGLSSEARENFGYLVRSARDLRRRIDSLLDYARAGRVVLEPEEVSLERCVDLALRVVGDELRECGASLERSNLPVANVDLAWIAVLYRHLLDNVVRHSLRDSPAIALTARTTGTEWVLGVRDNGVGIEAAHAERVFVPFERAHGRGAGLGLAIARRIAERHGGRLWLEVPAAEGASGAHFLFSLPRG